MVSCLVGFCTRKLSKGILNGVSQSLFWAVGMSQSNKIGGKIPSNAQAIIHSKFRNNRFGFSTAKVKSFRSIPCKVCHMVTALAKSYMLGGIGH